MRLNWIIYQSADALRIAGILLQPIMPSKAAELLNGLGVKPERRTIEFAEKGKDLDFGVVAQLTTNRARDRATAQWESLFPPVPGVELLDEEAVAEFTASAPSKSKNRLNRVSEAVAEQARKD